MPLISTLAKFSKRFRCLSMDEKLRIAHGPGAAAVFGKVSDDPNLIICLF
jgi:hypothetical protein